MSVMRIFASSVTVPAPPWVPEVGDNSSENPEGGAILQGDSTSRQLPIGGGMLLKLSVFTASAVLPASTSPDGGQEDDVLEVTTLSLPKEEHEEDGELGVHELDSAEAVM